MYRLIVQYPEKPTIPDHSPYGSEGIPFSWPMKRDYLSLGGAQHRANLFREYGATVEIVASRPVSWEPQPVAFEGQCWLFEYDDPHSGEVPELICGDNSGG